MSEKGTRGGLLGGAWWRAPRARRLLVRSGAVAAAVAVLVVIPGYLASQPWFVARRADLRVQHKAWSASAHAEVTCGRCHVRPDAPSQALHALRTLREAYLSVPFPSRRADLFATPTNAACLRCHSDTRTVSVSGDLRIPHRAHVRVLGMACVRCHEHLVHEKNPEGTNKPRMVMCLECHDGHRAKNSCSTCHTRKAAPATHSSADWLIVHSQKQKEYDCASCHGWTKDWCGDCHRRRPSSHDARWRTNHPARVQAHRNCEACHAAAFCIRCHGVLPRLNLGPLAEPAS